jgi:hypothetical protein
VSVNPIKHEDVCAASAGPEAAIASGAWVQVASEAAVPEAAPCGRLSAFAEGPFACWRDALPCRACFVAGPQWEVPEQPAVAEPRWGRECFRVPQHGVPPLGDAGPFDRAWLEAAEPPLVA